MNIDKKLLEVQQSLVEQKIDGWLFYDFRRSNDLACQFLEIPPEQLLTRRFFYWIPQKGDPVKIVHGVESGVLHHLPGRTVTYHSWQEWEEAVEGVLKKAKKVAMEYSPRNAIPYVSKVDAGTIDLVRELGVEVISSADLLQKFTSVWSEFQFQTHLGAANVLCQIVDDVWKLIARSLSEQNFLTEYEVQQFMLGEFEKHNCMSDDAPICAVDAHSADPHYAPTKEMSSVIRPGCFVLIDLWCKKKEKQAVYADITRVACASSHPSERQQQIFTLVKQARDAAATFVNLRYSQGQPLMGWEVDQVSRKVIEDAGFGQYFIHRTGHNIGEKDHGNGANIDNFETQDRRILQPGTCFSIEPGIYLPGEFGVRLEYNIYLYPQKPAIEITGGIQNELVYLLNN